MIPAKQIKSIRKIPMLFTLCGVKTSQRACPPVSLRIEFLIYSGDFINDPIKTPCLHNLNTVNEYLKHGVSVM